MMNVTIEVDEATVRGLVRRHVNDLMGCEVADSEIRIEVKSKQNYKSEWETAAFRAIVRATR